MSGMKELSEEALKEIEEWEATLEGDDIELARESKEDLNQWLKELGDE